MAVALRGPRQVRHELDAQGLLDFVENFALHRLPIALLRFEDVLAVAGIIDADVATVELALAASAWQIRQGAARALAGAPSSATAVAPLSRALSDPHLDVRKAAVLSLTRWADSEEAARAALVGALDDGDADVRAYARQALAAH